MLFDSAKMVPFGRPSPAVLACVLIACVSLGSATLDGGKDTLSAMRIYSDVTMLRACMAAVD